jgi:hypothetical protein
MAYFGAKDPLLFGGGVEDLHGQDGRTVLAIDDIGKRFSFFGFGLIL